MLINISQSAKNICGQRSFPSSTAASRKKRNGNEEAPERILILAANEHHLCFHVFCLLYF